MEYLIGMFAIGLFGNLILRRVPRGNARRLFGIVVMVAVMTCGMLWFTSRA